MMPILQKNSMIAEAVDDVCFIGIHISTPSTGGWE